MSKSKAAKAAGITTVENVTNMERTKTYQALEHKYAEHLEQQIGLGEVAAEHKKNILQDVDKGAKNNAIKLFLDRVEPEQQQKDDDDKMIIIMRQ